MFRSVRLMSGNGAEVVAKAGTPLFKKRGRSRTDTGTDTRPGAEPGTILTSIRALSLVSKGEGRAAPGAEGLATN